jgi:putative endonuclease
MMTALVPPAGSLFAMSTRKFIPSAEWEDERQVRGLQGEREAIAYLTSCGWSIEAHRFKLGRHDVDLVVRRGNTVAFIEVKTRLGSGCGTAGEAIGLRKQETVARVAEIWRLRFGRPGDEYRFDAVLVRERGSGGWEIEHVEDAWRRGGR